MYTVNVKLSGLTCEACTKLAKKRIEQLDGVKEAKVLLTGETEIVSKRMVLKNEIKNTLQGSGYDIL